MPQSVSENATEPFLCEIGAVGYDHHAGVQAVADAHTAPVMKTYPARAPRGVEQRIKDWPVGDRVAAVFHRFGFAVRRRDASGVKVSRGRSRGVLWKVLPFAPFR